MNSDVFYRDDEDGKWWGVWDDEDETFWYEHPRRDLRGLKRLTQYHPPSHRWYKVENSCKLPGTICASCDALIVHRTDYLCESCR